MHSSRMLTGRSWTVCRSLLPGGGPGPGGVCLVRGVSAPGGAWSGGGGVVVSGLGGGVCSQGGSAPRGGWGLLPGGVPGPGGMVVSGPGGGVCSGGGAAPRGGSQYALRQTPLPPPLDRQTPVKILPWPNFVAAGNK